MRKSASVVYNSYGLGNLDLQYVPSILRFGRCVRSDSGVAEHLRLETPTCDLFPKH